MHSDIIDSYISLLHNQVRTWDKLPNACGTVKVSREQRNGKQEITSYSIVYFKNIFKWIQEISDQKAK